MNAKHDEPLSILRQLELMRDLQRLANDRAQEEQRIRTALEAGEREADRAFEADSRDAETRYASARDAARAQYEQSRAAVEHEYQSERDAAQQQYKGLRQDVETQRKCAARLPLAISAVARRELSGRSLDPIPDAPTLTTAFRAISHGCLQRRASIYQRGARPNRALRLTGRLTPARQCLGPEGRPGSPPTCRPASGGASWWPGRPDS